MSYQPLTSHEAGSGRPSLDLEQRPARCWQSAEGVCTRQGQSTRRGLSILAVHEVSTPLSVTGPKSCNT